MQKLLETLFARRRELLAKTKDDNLTVIKSKEMWDNYSQFINQLVNESRQILHAFYEYIQSHPDLFHYSLLHVYDYDNNRIDSINYDTKRGGLRIERYHAPNFGEEREIVIVPFLWMNDPDEYTRQRTVKVYQRSLKFRLKEIDISKQKILDDESLCDDYRKIILENSGDIECN